MVRRYLKRERIFIIPTGQGIIFLVFIISMIFMGAIYANQLVNLMGFLLLTIYALAMITTHQNLSKMESPRLGINPSFAGETMVLSLTYVNRLREERMGLRLRWQEMTNDGKLHWGPFFNLPVLEGPAGERRLNLNTSFDTRGLRRFSRFQIETRAPLGLFRAWRSEKLPLEFTVYPRRRVLEVLPAELEQASNNAEEWEDPIPVEVNDWIRRMDWKRFAKTDRPWMRPWVGEQDAVQELDWQDFAEVLLEARLSHFTAMVSESIDAGKHLKVSGPWGVIQVKGPSEATALYEAFGRWSERP